MAKQTTTTPAPAWKNEKCGDCGLGTWVDTHSNLDLKGKPLCLTCPHKPGHVFRRNKACNKFIKITA